MAIKHNNVRIYCSLYLVKIEVIANFCGLGFCSKSPTTISASNGRLVSGLILTRLVDFTGVSSSKGGDRYGDWGVGVIGEDRMNGYFGRRGELKLMDWVST